MITYTSCSQVDFKDVHSAFLEGFSDYIIKFTPTQADFKERFFGAEGNSLDNSFIAYEGQNPVALALGGIRNYHGVKTLRCGAMCVFPSFRRKGLSLMLLDMLKEKAKEQGCKQFMLEVIVENHRAVKAYEKYGFEKLYDYYYYTLQDTSTLRSMPEGYEVRELSKEEIKSLEHNFSDYPLNWQGTFEYGYLLANIKYYGVYQGDSLVGLMSLVGGRVSFLWVNKEHRNKGIATGLIRHGALENSLEKLSIIVVNNSMLYGFVKGLGFQRDNISQYEMYLHL